AAKGIADDRAPAERHVSRLLGIDLGDRRMGLAVGETRTATARAFATLTRGTLDDDVRRLARVIAEQHVDELVIGLPLLPSGAEGEQASITRAWGVAVAQRLGLPLTWQDERFSSVAAEATVGAARRGHAGGPPGDEARSQQRAAVDREAARRIVQAALDARAGIVA
ncbi:MAG: Holliday junction resolvase RuvX, partial [Candidatus Limnocylindrales bacterium]